MHRDNKCPSCHRDGYMGYCKRDITHIGTGEKTVFYGWGCDFCQNYWEITKQIFENFASMANIIGARAVNS